jgi:hypothetical protein
MKNFHKAVNPNITESKRNYGNMCFNLKYKIKEIIKKPKKYLDKKNGLVIGYKTNENNSNTTNDMNYYENMEKVRMK